MEGDVKEKTERQKDRKKTKDSTVLFGEYR
jgi:hypothetical protein